jgi:type IV secretion system protein VirD4
MKLKGIRLGHSRESGDVLRYSGPGCLVTIAPPRSGKGRDILIPALMDLETSVVCVDVKSELAAVTSRKRQRFGKVIYLDPYGMAARFIKGAKASRYNPMARLNPRSIEFSAQAEKIADGLVWDEGETARFFTGGARGLCSMVEMGLAEHAEPHEKNLTALRSVITGEFQGGVDAFGFAQSILDNSTNMALRQKAARFCVPGARQSRSLADVIQTADGETRFLSDAAMADSLSVSDFSFADLRKEVTTVYVILPLDYLDVCGKYFRLIIASALSELLQAHSGGRVVILMDEFFQLGRLDAIRNAMSMASGLNVQLWPVIQDINQLIELYPQGWETFLSAGVRMFFGPPRDDRTSTYVSGLCGQTERRTISRSISYQDEAEQEAQSKKHGRGNQSGMNVPNINLSFGSVSRQLLLPHEVRELGSDEMLLFVEGVNGVIRAKRRPYWDEPEFRGQYSKNPYFD